MTVTFHKEAVELLGKKLDSIMEGEAACTEEHQPLKGMILGGFALQAICDSYGVKVPRKTKDIDLYTPDARTIMSEDVAISPTGARIQLTPDFHAELFDWISGMDHDGFLEDKILNGLESNNFQRAYESKFVKLYIPTPEIFVANKLFAYRGQTSREKDLKDVGTLVSVLKKEDASALEEISAIVKHYGLEKEYKLALKYCKE